MRLRSLQERLGLLLKPAEGKVTYRDIFLRWVWLGCAVTTEFINTLHALRL